MITIRKSDERGRAWHGWLESRHTFSFASYHDPMHMGFRSLRVINEDKVEAGKGFAAHSHRDMEIISYVVEGSLEHRDSMGNGSVVRRGDVQLMRAGIGVTHSEYNHSRESPLHFLQIWIVPDQTGLAPAYEQLHFTPDELTNTLRCVVSPQADPASLRIHQDASMFVGLLDAGSEVGRELVPGRHAWIQIVSGKARVGGAAVEAGDGAAVRDESHINIEAEAATELLFFDLA